MLRYVNLMLPINFVNRILKKGFFNNFFCSCMQKFLVSVDMRLRTYKWIKFYGCHDRDNNLSKYGYYFSTPVEVWRWGMHFILNN